MNEELKKIFEDDQHDLRTLPPDRIERDRERRKRVKEILENGGAEEGIDYIHAAIVFQHGEALEDWWQAYLLSVKAVQLGFKPKWLAAVALDRWLIRQGKLLKYGNQVIPFGKVYRIPKIDPKTTDAEREDWDIPTLAELLSFTNLRGFMKYDVVSTLAIDNLRIKVIKLERHPVHHPLPTGRPCGKTEDMHIIYENTYGWQWIEDESGSFLLGWLLIPDVPEIAHAIADEGVISIEKVIMNNQSCIQVNETEHTTIYFKASNGIWAVTGVDDNAIFEKVMWISSSS
ncbi:hypothetical protein [Bacillus horti]|uniref:Uncharacterized protein n=1 Tax=Caldalkalibacillus horti TaxID=77523 RepID=A0ABT9VZ86_9BACI|nr:hypothetical protein [Bacillus horti]MDQ0166301.1 hypothetical protein [Bacillus horti]